MAIKGTDKSLVPLGTPSKVDVTSRGKKLRRGVRLWPVGVLVLKSELYHALKLPILESGPPAGYCHFPEYDAGYFKQLTAEQLVTKVVKGYPKREWQKIRERNEALDCRIYARAASIALGVDRFTDKQWQRLAGDDLSLKAPAKAVSETKSRVSASKPRPKIVKSKWMSGA